MQPCTVAAIQFDPQFRQKEANIGRIMSMLEEAAAEGARMIVLPEMATSGYCFLNRAEIADQVETVPGPTTERLSRFCREKRVYVAIGLGEVDENGDYFNTAAFLGPKGYMGKYRKTHLYAPECRWARPGDIGFPVFETHWGKVGLGICMDFYFNEPSRLLALAGAELLLNPTNWDLEPCPNWSWHARAWENGCYILSANRAGQERGVSFYGGSSLIGPDGQTISQMEREEGICYGRIGGDEKPWPNLDIDLLRDRRPSAYRDLSLPHQLYPEEYYYRLYDINPIPDLGDAVIGVWQCPAELRRAEKKAGLERIIATQKNLDLLVLPENLFLPRIADRDAAAAALTEQDALLTWMCGLLGKKLFLVTSILEREGDRYYPTIVLLGAEGILHRQRKVHLTRRESCWATAGDHFSCYDLPWGRLGLLSGTDALFPEAPLVLASQGADLIAISAALMGPKPISGEKQYAFGIESPWFWHFWRIKANETDTFIAAANLGAPYMGYSGVFTPSFPDRRERIAGGDGAEQLAIAIKATDDRAALRHKESMGRRQPHLYAKLTHP